jgi:hypothetical protein
VDETTADKGFIKVTVYKKNFIHHWFWDSVCPLQVFQASD